MIKYTLLLLFMLLDSAVYSQQTFTISGTVRSTAKYHQPLDNSEVVELFIKTNQIAKTYCDNNGKYQFILSDSLNGKDLQIYFYQDETKIKPSDHVDGPCPTDCYTNKKFLTAVKNIKINLDSTYDYKIDHFAGLMSLCPYFPDVYFEKNKLLIDKKFIFYFHADNLNHLQSANIHHQRNNS